MLDFMLLFSKIFNTFSLVKIILSLCSWEKSQEIQKPVSDLQSICYTGIYLDGSDRIRQELCVLIQHYFSDPKRKMRPTAGHKLCQTLTANLHPSVFSIKPRRTISRTVVLVLAPVLWAKDWGRRRITVSLTDGLNYSLFGKLETGEINTMSFSLCRSQLLSTLLG